MSRRSDPHPGAVAVALALVDPRDLTVKWHNEFAQRMLPEPYRSNGLVGHSVTDLLPVMKALGVTTKLDDVARSGVPYHMTTHVIGSGDAGATVRASAYRLPSGELLLVTDER